jgi:hypothetical protein
MQANNIDTDSEHLSGTQEGEVRGLANAAVYELSQTRADTLRNIDQGGFSCVASLFLSLFSRLFTVTLL